MLPSNEHERTIALVIDEWAAYYGTINYSALPVIASKLNFMLSRSDSEFLVAYLKWRTDNPILRAE